LHSYYLLGELVQIVRIFVAFLKQKAPEAMATFGDAMGSALLDRVEQKSAKKIRVNMLHHFDQVSVIKLEGRRKLAHQLVNTVKKL
jgi:hypothetical protein